MYRYQLIFKALSVMKKSTCNFSYLALCCKDCQFPFNINKIVLTAHVFQKIIHALIHVFKKIKAKECSLSNLMYQEEE